MRLSLAVIAVSALATAVAARAEVSSPCADGTRLVIESHGRNPSPPRLLGVVDGQWWFESCPTGAAARFRKRPRALGFHVGFSECGDGGTTANFSGRVTTDCASLRAVLRRTHPKRIERVTGHPSRCGDGVQDEPNGEQCDGSAGVCTAPLACTASCTCEDPDVPLDPSFGTNGVVTVDDAPLALAVDGAGRLLVLYGTADHFGIRRLSATGQLERDVQFAKASVQAGDEFGILLLGDGGFLTNAGAIRRFDDSADPVTSFGDGETLPAALAVRELDDGRLATFNGADGLRRYLADGTPDPTFTPLPSPVPVDGELQRASFLADGRLVFVTRHLGNTHAMIARRVLTDGSLDPAFGDGGVFVALPWSDVVTSVRQLLTLPDASFVMRILYYAGSHPQYQAGRIGTDGTDDPRTVPAADGRYAVDAVGRLLVASGVQVGTGFSAPRLQLERRLADGTLDLSFGRAGSILTGVKGHLFGFGNGAVDVFGLVGLPDGKLLVGAEGKILRLQP